MRISLEDKIMGHREELDAEIKRLWDYVNEQRELTEAEFEQLRDEIDKLRGGSDAGA